MVCSEQWNMKSDGIIYTFSAILFDNSIFFSNFVAIKRKKYGKEDFEATARGHTDL